MSATGYRVYRLTRKNSTVSPEIDESVLYCTSTGKKENTNKKILLWIMMLVQKKREFFSSFDFVSFSFIAPKRALKKTSLSISRRL
jgi:hypothetical protein